jgi:regulator of sirC expression with transglutaminase-like and TPR domain
MEEILWLNSLHMAESFPQDTAEQRAYRAFEALVSREDAAIDLAQAALLIACIEYPDLDMAHYIARLDALARRVRDLLALPDHAVLPQLPQEIEPLAVLHAINDVLFRQEQFYGNQADYYNSANSFLNKVLEEHTGIPISLSVLYMEVSRRVGLLIDGIGLPLHFVMRCRLPKGCIYIDAFDGGKLLSEQGCRELIYRMAGGKVKILPRWYEPVSHKQLLSRMLLNLKHIYLHNEAYPQAVAVCDRLLLLNPHAAVEYRDRGIIHLQLKHYGRALRDLKAYIELTPHAQDRDEILGHIKVIRQMIAMMN